METNNLKKIIEDKLGVELDSISIHPYYKGQAFNIFDVVAKVKNSMGYSTFNMTIHKGGKVVFNEDNEDEETKD